MDEYISIGDTPNILVTFSDQKGLRTVSWNNIYLPTISRINIFSLLAIERSSSVIECETSSCPLPGEDRGNNGQASNPGQGSTTSCSAACSTPIPRLEGRWSGTLCVYPRRIEEEVLSASLASRSSTSKVSYHISSSFSPESLVISSFFAKANPATFTPLPSGLVGGALPFRPLNDVFHPDLETRVLDDSFLEWQQVKQQGEVTEMRDVAERVAVGQAECETRALAPEIGTSPT